MSFTEAISKGNSQPFSRSEFEEISEPNEKVQTIAQQTITLLGDIAEVRKDQQEIKVDILRTAGEVKILLEESNTRALANEQPQSFDWQFYGLLALGVIVAVAIVVAGIALLILFA